MKIAFKLSTPEAVEYANGHKENKKEYYVDDSDEFYFHVPSSHRSAFGPLHILDHIAPGYTDVTKDFKEKYWRPWKDKLASDNAPSISGGDAPVDSGNSDIVALFAEKVTTFYSFTNWVNKAKSRLGAFGRYDVIVCVDKLGNICHIGEDFATADKLDLFPVTAYRLKRTIELTPKQ
jgi:hypothetical protein